MTATATGTAATQITTATAATPTMTDGTDTPTTSQYYSAVGTRAVPRVKWLPLLQAQLRLRLPLLQLLLRLWLTLTLLPHHSTIQQLELGRCQEWSELNLFCTLFMLIVPPMCNVSSQGLASTPLCRATFYSATWIQWQDWYCCRDMVHAVLSAMNVYCSLRHAAVVAWIQLQNRERTDLGNWLWTVTDLSESVRSRSSESTDTGLALIRHSAPSFALSNVDTTESHSWHKAVISLCRGLFCNVPQPADDVNAPEDFVWLVLYKWTYSFIQSPKALTIRHAMRQTFVRTEALILHKGMTPPYLKISLTLLMTLLNAA